ncbi:MAG: tetraacyldisaccharide 4'-kinase [Candidatus Riflebacteria bacterium]|nr:tetraacyldisaccharide 4'-kinase [Candidatus Riflebacteria bacterium]
MKNIILRDFKGLNATYELSPRVILTGPNGSGKSAIIDAFRILATGYTGLGKTPASTHSLASAKTTEITGTLSDNSLLTRRFEKKGSTVTQTISVNGTDVKAADYLQPPELFFPAESLHPNEFLSLSGDKRAAWLSSNVGTNIGTVAPDLFPYIEEAIGQINREEPVEKALTGLADKERILKNEIELAVSNLKRLTGQDHQLPAGTLAEWQEKLTTADAELEKLSREQAQNDERAKLASSKIAHTQRLKDQVKQGEQKIKEASGKIEEVTRKYALLGPDADSTILDKLRREINAKAERSAAILPESKRLRDAIKTFREKKCCPTCGTDAEFLKDQLDEWDFTAAGLEGEYETLASERDGISKEIQLAEQGVKNAQARKDLNNEIRILNDAIKSYRASVTGFVADIEKSETDTEMPVVGSTEILSARIEGLRAQKFEAQENVRKFTGAQTLAEARVRAEQDRQKGEKKLESIKSLVSDLKKSRDNFLNKATSAIITPFKTAVSAAFPGCDAFLQIVNDKGKPEVDFGILRDERRISFDTLSGGEKLVVLAALVAALQIARCGRPCVCLMEMAEADAERLDAVAAACDAIGFDQVILATCHTPKSSRANWSVMQMGVTA